MKAIKTAVIATADQSGQVFFPNEKPGKDGQIYGYIRLEQNEMSLGSVITTNTSSVLQQFSEKAARLVKQGMEFPGNLVSKDSFTPAYEGHEPMTVPVRDEEGKATDQLRYVTSGKKPVFRTVEYDATGTLEDSKFVYDKVEDGVLLVEDHAAVSAEAGVKLS